MAKEASDPTTPRRSRGPRQALGEFSDRDDSGPRFKLTHYGPSFLVLPASPIHGRIPSGVSDRISKEFAMEWTTPQHEEVDLNCEISSYANAEL
jgi:hypothetical protein